MSAAPVTLGLGRVDELALRSLGLTLTPAESRRLAGFQAPARRRQYLAGRWLLRHLCSSTVAGAPHEWSLSAEGVPVAWHKRGYLAPRLSLAHSGGWIAATACHGEAAGVDIELLGKKRDWAALLRHEGQRVPAKGRETKFLRYWTAHEAEIKSGRPSAVRYFGAEGWLGAVQLGVGQELRLKLIGPPPRGWHP